mmetsp:Transcript_4646/g.9998  ORF Transcript_4646/g.9998 Transcript_4646/m.9998 type:complete len:288 (+) Transcript_4646:235-1098(+)
MRTRRSTRFYARPRNGWTSWRRRNRRAPRRTRRRPAWRLARRTAPSRTARERTTRRTTRSASQSGRRTRTPTIWCTTATIPPTLRRPRRAAPSRLRRRRRFHRPCRWCRGTRCSGASCTSCNAFSTRPCRLFPCLAGSSSDSTTTSPSSSPTCATVAIPSATPPGRLAARRRSGRRRRRRLVVAVKRSTPRLVTRARAGPTAWWRRWASKRVYMKPGADTSSSRATTSPPRPAPVPGWCRCCWACSTTWAGVRPTRPAALVGRRRPRATSHSRRRAAWRFWRCGASW